MIEEKVFVECDCCGEMVTCKGRIGSFEMPEGWEKIIDSTGHGRHLCPCCVKRYEATAKRVNKEMGFEVLKCLTI